MLCSSKFMLVTLSYCPDVGEWKKTECFLSAIVIFSRFVLGIAEEIGNDITKTKPSRKFPSSKSDLDAVAFSAVSLV